MTEGSCSQKLWVGTNRGGKAVGGGKGNSNREEEKPRKKNVGIINKVVIEAANA